LRDAGVIIAARLVPLAPFIVMVEIVALADKVSGMQREADIAMVEKCLTDHAARIAQDAVLNIAKVEEAERLGLSRSGAELIPFAPPGRTLHTIGVYGV